MRETFEIRSFPDLSLPKYFDLFGEEALPVAATKLFAWLQIVACSSSDFSFTLRYLYDPSITPTNRRLRIFVIVQTAIGPDTSVMMGRRLSETALDIGEANVNAARHVDMSSWHVATLGRKDYVVYEAPDFFFLPASWTRHAAARTAMEPYLDEAFASLDSPALLDIQLHAADPSRARQALRAAMLNLERKRSSDGSSSDEYIQHYKALYDSILTDPVCRLLIIAASQKPSVAEGLLQAFGVDTIGGARFEVHSLAFDTEASVRIANAISEGTYEFSDQNGWFKPTLLKTVNEKNINLSDPQIRVLKGLSELSVLAGRDLIQDALTLPIPRRGYLRTFPLETELDRSQSKVLPSRATGSIVLGEDLERKSSISLRTEDLTRHGFVAGVTGSGKTVTMFNILSQLAEQHVPFVVFEPAKSEYRGLANFKALRDDLRVYTPGRDDLSPIRINPFEFESHITLSEHLGNLAAAFSCALALFNPLPSILEEALWQIYESKGWKEDSFGNAGFDLPRVDELPRVINEIIDGLNYDSEITSNFKAAFRSRFTALARGSVGRLFDCDASSPAIAEMCRSMSVIELRALTQQQANLVTLFMMISLRELLRSTVNVSDGVRLVLVLEEAHNLVPEVPEHLSDGEEGSARAEASRYIANMLAEMRALGLSILVVDQTPAAVSKQVIRNTNLKIAHRTVAKDDRETLADTMMMHPGHAELLGRLAPGQAYIYSDKFYRPHLVQNAFAAGDTHLTKKATAKSSAKKQASGTPPSDAELTEWLSGRKWFKESVERRSEALRKRGQSLLAQAEECMEIMSEYMNLIKALSSSSARDAAVLAEIDAVKGEAANYCRLALDSLTPQLRSFEVEQRAVENAARSVKGIACDESISEVLSVCIASLKQQHAFLIQSS